MCALLYLCKSRNSHLKVYKKTKRLKMQEFMLIKHVFMQKQRNGPSINIIQDYLHPNKTHKYFALISDFCVFMHATGKVVAM